ncbi:MAG: Rv3235 family protein [Nitriliruptoraceae bacterium]
MSSPYRPQRTRRPAGGHPPDPDPQRLARLLAQAWLEVRSGRRPLHQLRPLLSPATFRRLAAQLRRCPPTPADEIRVRRVTASHPTPEACEASVLIEQRGRTTAIAMRLERHLGAWRAVELTAPETGLPPLQTRSLPAGHRARDAFDEVLEEAGEQRPPS